MVQKRGPGEEKSDFEFLAFLVLYYINKACVKNSEQSFKGKVKTHNNVNRQNQ
jgi:hypothetical protein